MTYVLAVNIACLTRKHGKLYLKNFKKKLKMTYVLAVNTARLTREHGKLYLKNFKKKT